MEIKQEIAQLVNALPAEQLREVLAYLRQLRQQVPATTPLSANLAAVLAEDQEVLTRLAQ